MKIYKNIKRLAILVGMIYGLWLGAHNGCTDSEVMAGLIMIILAGILSISVMEEQIAQQSKDK